MGTGTEAAVNFEALALLLSACELLPAQGGDGAEYAFGAAAAVEARGRVVALA